MDGRETQPITPRPILPAAAGDRHGHVGVPAGPQPDVAAIRETLDLLFDPGDVTEVRIPDTARAGTVSGYYDHDSFDKLADDVVQANRRYGTTYILLNPVKPALLARRKNRLSERVKVTTSDADVLRLAHLLIDIDALRPAGISSTDAEHEAALDRVREICATLIALGWPPPLIVGDSGNGGHLIFVIGLENTPANVDLLKRVLAALDFTFSTAVAAVDTTTYNPARVTKLFGTVATKGDDTSERPHRLSQILDTTPNTLAVSHEQLEEVAAWLPTTPAAVPRKHADGNNFDLATWITERGLPVVAEGAWGTGGHKWILNPCPFNESHTNRAAYIVQQPGGAISAGCKHSSCAGKGWSDLRTLFEPERERRAPGRPRKSAAAGAGTVLSEDQLKALTVTLADAITDDTAFAQDGGGKLYRYDGGTYRPDGETFLRQQVKTLLLDWHLPGLWTIERVRGVVEYVRVDAPLLWETPPLDRICVRNGLIDVSGDVPVLLDHTPDFLSAVQLPVVYDPAATCPAWEQFVSEVFPADATAVPWEVAAWLMVPDRSLQKAVLLMGEGSNGKSVFLAALTAFLGRSNTAAVSLHKLEQDRFAVSRLVGKLADIVPDLPTAHLASTSTFKTVTGGDAVQAEYKFRDAFEFSPFARLVFSANAYPRAPDASRAFFRRWLVVPFERTFTPGTDALPRRDLDALLAAPGELSGLLNKALAALPRVLDRGFTDAKSLGDALAEFQSVTDPLTVWLTQNTYVAPEASIAKSILIQAYNNDGRASGRPGETANAFARALKRHYPWVGERQVTVLGQHRWVWTGIGYGPGPGSTDANDLPDGFGFETSTPAADAGVPAKMSGLPGPVMSGVTRELFPSHPDNPDNPDIFATCCEEEIKKYPEEAIRKQDSAEERAKAGELQRYPTTRDENVGIVGTAPSPESPDMHRNGYGSHDSVMPPGVNGATQPGPFYGSRGAALGTLAGALIAADPDLVSVPAAAYLCTCQVPACGSRTVVWSRSLGAHRCLDHLVAALANRAGGAPDVAGLRLTLWRLAAALNFPSIYGRVESGPGCWAGFVTTAPDRVIGEAGWLLSRPEPERSRLLAVGD